VSDLYDNTGSAWITFQFVMLIFGYRLIWWSGIKKTEDKELEIQDSYKISSLFCYYLRKKNFFIGKNNKNNNFRIWDQNQINHNHMINVVNIGH
jgi:hypothetical protein